ncbi:glycosyltransferase family 2 protein [Floridanema evergladense]|uniref:Glycosyltransferase family 2 protein n=1 Tax=Floridaenema evergladense BLCC-F167 TaxID=3153639 RepID=A0ABV4WXA0_9CYAN
MKTAVAFLIFKRPDTTKKVFEAIRQAKPPKLLVVADGPRPDRPDEMEKCAATRKIIDSIDWQCELLTNYSDSNLGCKNRVSSGLDWVFENVEEAIILEDDCLPHPTFFPFCEELLEYYRDDTRIMSVCGDSSRSKLKRTNYSYFFSCTTPIWGWATWRRAWQYYDVNMKLWPLIKDGNWCKDILFQPEIIEAWENKFQNVYSGTIDTWDYQWTFACWIQNGLSAIANVNLISNCGFHAEATHTKEIDHRLANQPTKAMEFPLKHPPFVIRDTQAEYYHFKHDNPGLAFRAKKKAQKILNQFIPKFSSRS